jgi:hypothetical protein
MSRHCFPIVNFFFCWVGFDRRRATRNKMICTDKYDLRHFILFLISTVYIIIIEGPKKKRLYTFLGGHHARVVEEGVAKSVAIRVDGRLSAEAGRMEDRKGLQGPQSGLTFSHRRRRARH